MGGGGGGGAPRTAASFYSANMCTFFKLEIILDKSGYQLVIRDHLLRSYVVNAQSFKTRKLSKCSIKISEDPMFLDNKLPRSDARHVNSYTDKFVSRTLFHSYCSFGRSEKFGTFIYFSFGVLLKEN